MTTEELADKHRVGVGSVKALLRRGFPDQDFRPPGKTLASEHVRYVDEHIGEHVRERRSRGEDVISVVDYRPPPESAASLPAALQSVTAHLPRSGGEHRIHLHVDIVKFLENPREERRLKASVKRLLREMLVGGRSQRRVKSTRGANTGWLRAPLGDNGGHHYYLWHALQGQRPVQGLALERGDVAVRAVRHHDATKDVFDGGSPDDYLIFDAREYVEMFESDAAEADVLSQEQRDAFQSAAFASITKGHPGAGKTTLQLERARRQEGRLLFLTFGAAQRDEAERWLRTYAPTDLAFQAWTHEQLLRALDPGWTPPPPAEEAASALAEALGGELPRLGPWRNRMTALYAELRAHYWGRALPIELRGTSASVDEASRKRSYRERRTEVLGEASVEAALRAADALPEESRRRLFGDLERAAAIAGALIARGAEALPEELRTLGAVLVDEVQDLTLVEALVCVLVVHAAARGAGIRPAFHAAGDEGQTVRATDFDWGELKDLIALLLTAPEEFQLPGNVRSPRTLTRVVNRSWDLYKAFGKSQRPRGYAEAEVDESAVGSVLWVDARQDLDPVFAAIAKIPGAALVYAGISVPRDVREAADRAGVLLSLGAPEAKGLDFRVVFVLDAGRVAHQVWSTATSSRGEEAVVEIENRIRVDSIRVAISRSTEVLVFVERELDEPARRRLAALCGGEHELFEGVVTDASIDRLEALVDVDTADRTELVTELLAEHERTFADDPITGLRIAERAREWLGDSNRAGAVQGRLRQEVYLAHGRALLRVATLGVRPRAEIAALLARANAAFNHAHEKELARLSLDARDALSPDHATVKSGLARIAQRALDPAAPGAAEALATLRLFVTNASADAAGYDLLGWGRLLDELAAIGGAAARHPDLAAARQELVARAARWALAAAPGPGATRLAERALESMQEPPAELRARLAERQQRWADAIELFQAAGLPDDALRISRESGEDARRSARLAKEAGADAAALLERLARIHAELAELDASALTEGEQAHLGRVVQEKLPRRKLSRRT
ncbi:MAG TPA: hypothetical protein VNO30_08370 [Kofleriaceae bacterium]|nr:hypothetical protein [Kofleriaceae bacterium]